MATSRVLFGFHAITARLRTRPDSIHALYMASARQDARARDIAARAQSVRIAIHAVDDARLLQLAGHGRHQGIVALVDEALPYVTLDDVLETADGYRILDVNAAPGIEQLELTTGRDLAKLVIDGARAFVDTQNGHGKRPGRRKQKS